MTIPTGEQLAAQIENALRLVIDPELGCNIVDLGLVYVVAVGEDGDARLLMTTTTRGCPASEFLKEGAAQAAGSVPGVASVEVTLTYDPPWGPEMMTSSAKLQLNFAAEGAS